MPPEEYSWQTDDVLVSCGKFLMGVMDDKSGG